MSAPQPPGVREHPDSRRALRSRIGPSAWCPLALLAALNCSPLPEPRNLLLVVIDSLRADHVGAYGEPRGTSPFLDRLAREGRSFDRAYATTTWTLGSVGSMMTGLYASELGLRRLSSVLPDDVDTLAELLRAHGYATGAVVSHSLVDSTHGFARGFDLFDQTEAGGYGHVCTPGVTARAQQLLGEFGTRRAPFFLFVHYFDPHFDYRDHPEYAWAGPAPSRFPRGLRFWSSEGVEWNSLNEEEVRYVTDCYDEEIRLTDAGLGRLLRSLEESGMDERTLVVVTADHGEEFLQHGRLGHGTETLLYQDVTRVPLVVRGPGVVSGRHEAPVSLLGLRAALLRLLGLPDPLRAHEGTLPLASPGDVPPPPNALAEFVLSPEKGDISRHVLIGPRLSVMSCPPHSPVEVYDLETDPGERSDLAPTHALLADSLLGVLRAEIEKLEVRDPERSPRTVLTPARKEELEALGYTGD